MPARRLPASFLLVLVVACERGATTSVDVLPDAGSRLRRDGGGGFSGDAAVAASPPQFSSCEVSRAPGYCPVALAANCEAGGDCCSSDAECSAGRNGRCVGAVSEFAEVCRCSYDECTGEDPCGVDTVCSCGVEIPVAFQVVRTPHLCVAGECRTNADCPEGGECAPTYREQCNQLFEVVGYYCRSSEDSCSEHGDCAGAAGAPPRFCLYDTAGGRFTCMESFGCP